MGGREAGDRENRGGRPVVADSSPLIALDRIDGLSLLPQLFGQLVVPPAVTRALGAIWPQQWIVMRVPKRPFDPRVHPPRLDPGEREAIALAMQLDIDRILIDDLPARRLAIALDLHVTGTVGVLIAAKQRGFLPAVRPSLDALMATGFRIGSQLVERVLSDSGEAE